MGFFWFQSHPIKLSTVSSTIVIPHILSFAMSDEEFLTFDIENKDDEDDELVVDEGMHDNGVSEELKTV